MSDKEFDIKKAYERWLREEQRGSRGKKGSREESGSRTEKNSRAEDGNRPDKGSREKEPSDRSGKNSIHSVSDVQGDRTADNGTSGRKYAKKGARGSSSGGGKKAESPDSGRRPARESMRVKEGTRVRIEQRANLQGENAGGNIVCPYAKRCGGCSYINRDYEWTLGYKEMKIRRLLKPYVNLSGIVGMEDPFHYRNKVHAVFAHVRDGHRERNVAGIYEQGTHKVVPVEKCMIENEKADEIIQDILRMLSSFKIKVYDEDTGYGLLRHVLVRTAHVTGQIMVVLVLSSPILPGKNNFVKALREKHPEITTIILNVNDEQTSMVLGERETVLYGKGYIEDRLCGHTFRISAKSFYQVNSVQTEKLYRKAVEYANLTGHERVIDAY